MDEIGEVLRLVFFYYGASAIIPAVELFEELEEG
jgi:alkylhydroperoxidase/carboxymuconolactone decarboxylase family protein YurZ